MSDLDQIPRRYGFAPYKIRYGRPGASEFRAVYLPKDAGVQLDEDKTRLNDAVFVGVTTKLDRFVAGRRVTVSTPATSKTNGDVKGLKGNDDILFELRFFEVAPQQRLLGVFPKKDFFLALGMYERDELEGDWNKHCRRMLKKIGVMGTNAPKCISHHDIDKVLSNWGFPQ